MTIMIMTIKRARVLLFSIKLLDDQARPRLHLLKDFGFGLTKRKVM